MTTENIRKKIEEKSGKGRLFNEDLLIDDVYYEYKIYQDFSIIRTQNGTDSIPGIKTLIGNISINNMNRDLLGMSLKLITDDNTSLSILLQREIRNGEFGFVLGSS